VTLIEIRRLKILPLLLLFVLSEDLVKFLIVALQLGISVHEMDIINQ
jgi:hypothetical protein